MDPNRTVVDSTGSPVSIVYVEPEPKDGERPVLCVAHRLDGNASAWVTADGKLDSKRSAPAIFFEEEAGLGGAKAPEAPVDWKPAKA